MKKMTLNQIWLPNDHKELKQRRFWVTKANRKWGISTFNPLSPNISIQILQTDLHTFPLWISWENLTTDQGIFSLVIIC